jgi:hypothetical protein
MIAIHPIAEAYPPLSEQELSAMKQSIKAVGQINPVITLNGQALDGRNRLIVCDELGIDPETTEYEGPSDIDSLIDFVRGVNEVRRHLTATQRGVIASKLAAMREGSPTANLQLEAKRQGVSERTAWDARRATGDDAAPAIAKAVTAGTVSASDAASIVTLPKQKQVAALKKVESGQAASLRKAAESNGSHKSNGKPLLDDRSKPVPANLQLPFAARFQMQELVQQAGNLLSEAEKLRKNTPGCELLPRNEIRTKIEDFQTAVKDNMPAFVCNCMGLGCKDCKNRGWLPKRTGVVLD